MKKTFRQSMAWLHTWSGLCVGWLLYLIFLTGTLGYVNHEIDRWMRPEAPLTQALPPAADMARRAQEYLAATAPDSAQWIVQFPGDRYMSDLTVGALAPRTDGQRGQELSWQTLDARTGAPFDYQPRDTGGGMALYWLHFELYYVSRPVGALIVGVCAMFMLVALLTGLVTHRRIFTDFFSFRPAKAQRSWLDAHNVMSITALPFHLMITWSGLMFFMFTYMPLGMTTLYPSQAARSAFIQQAQTAKRAAPMIRPFNATPGADAPLVDLEKVAANAEKVWGEGEVSTIEVALPNRSNARITARARRDLGVIGRDAPALRFDLASGEPIEPVASSVYTAPGAFQTVMIGLHKANFARPWLRLLFVFTGLLSTGMIATGLVLWSSKRKARLAEGVHAPASLRVVDALNAAAIIGFPTAIGLYFWANRLLPVGLEERAAWEMNCLFSAWAATTLFALLRPPARLWVEMSLIAAAVYGAIPVLNIVTTDRHLGVTIPAGDWGFAGFDLSMFAIGAAFAATAWMVARRRQRERETRDAVPSGAVEARS